MATVTKYHVDRDADVGIFIVQFATGDTLVADDASTVPMDYASASLRSALDLHMPGWRSKELTATALLLPGDGLALPDGTNKAAPIPVAAMTEDETSDTYTFASTIDLRTDNTPAAILGLIASTDADAALDAAEIHRVVVIVGPRRPGHQKASFTSLPETFTADGS